MTLPSEIWAHVASFLRDPEPFSRACRLFACLTGSRRRRRRLAVFRVASHWMSRIPPRYQDLLYRPAFDRAFERLFCEARQQFDAISLPILVRQSLLGHVMLMASAFFETAGVIQVHLEGAQFARLAIRALLAALDLSPLPPWRVRPRCRVWDPSEDDAFVSFLLRVWEPDRARLHWCPVLRHPAREQRAELVADAASTES